MDLQTATNDELHHEWWERMRICAEQQTLTCGCAVDPMNPQERCDRCRSFAEARDEVEHELRRRGEWNDTAAPPRHPVLYNTPRDRIIGEGKGPWPEVQSD